MKKIEKFLQRCPATGRITGFKSMRKLPIFIFMLTGFVSLIWFLIRVIPKPSRAAYPCMKASMPIAAAFAIYLGSIATSFLLYKRIKHSLHDKKYLLSVLLILVFFGIGFILIIPKSKTVAAAGSGANILFKDPIGPNAPIGDAKGIFPGRVVWIHDPAATNPDCNPDYYGDGYFLPFNSNQEVIDRMVSEAITRLVNADSEEQAWELIFKDFNSQHRKGSIGYQQGERIFIKVNSVHAWTTNTGGDIKNNNDYGKVDTSPQFVLAVLKQLVEKAGVPQEMIYVGDPFTRMFNHCYELWDAIYPDVHYLSRDPLPGREVFTKTTTESVFYSDKGSVLNQLSDRMVDQVAQANYIINLPAFKAHRWAGVTFFAKNHFGSHARGSSIHLHSGLHRTDYDLPLRDQYQSYRVFVDLMASSQLGGKTLIYLMDGLWGTSEEHLPPVKFRSAPFYNHWSSSVFASLDPVAIESVCLDILQKEFKTEELNSNPPRYTFVQWNAVDDYLHQAADANWWPEGINYDPDNTGSPISSLGVHEHWNNDELMEYSRNLKTGEGIELIKLFADQSDLQRFSYFPASFNIFPNPAATIVNISIASRKPAFANLDIYSLNGARLMNVFNGEINNKERVVQLDARNLSPGIYTLILTLLAGEEDYSDNRKLIIVNK